MPNLITHELSITRTDDKKVEGIKIPLGVTTIGRQVGVDLQLDSPQVSRRHAQLVCTKAECEISDEGSSNGTYVNGEKLTPQAPVLLNTGDKIKIGPFELVYRQVSIEVPEPEPDPDAEAAPPRLDAEPEPAVEAALQEPEPEPERPDEKVTADLPDKGAEEEPLPRRRRKSASPPPPPAEPPIPPDPGITQPESFFAPGLDRHSQRLINFLPGIYHTDFMSRFLGMFEGILTPIEWNVDNFDLFLDPGTAPESFLPWLASWFALTTDPTWTESQRRLLLKDAHAIFARRGTRWALGRVLEIYTGQPPEIIDDGKDQDPFTFKVRLPVRKGDVNPELVEALIDAHKPAHTLYETTYKR